MSSQAKIEANRRNARRSTGPRTPEGKARSSRNALKHGLFAGDAVLPDEDRQAFLELLTALEADQQPASPLEQILLRQLAIAIWRLCRLNRIEVGVLSSGLEDLRAREDGAPEPTPEEDYDEATRRLGRAFRRAARSNDAISRLIRYEATLQRAFYRTLERLRYFQSCRAGQAPPPARLAPEAAQVTPAQPNTQKLRKEAKTAAPRRRRSPPGPPCTIEA